MKRTFPGARRATLKAHISMAEGVGFVPKITIYEVNFA
jgi:hypothetical protein